MKLAIYKIVSSHDPVPLAQIRTDGHVVEFIVDNTNGKLPAQVMAVDQRKSTMFASLQSIVNDTYHLQMQEDQSFVPQVLRYVLENGDVAEITTDGLTASLNGELLSEQEKKALFSAITSGELRVARDEHEHGRPMPVVSPNIPQSAPSAPEKKPLVSREFIEGLAQIHAQKEAAQKNASSDHDQDIEDMEFSDEVADKGFAKNLAYCLKYGRPKGAK